MVDNRDEPTAKERRELASLPREINPPEALESEVINALRRRGLLSKRGHWWRTQPRGVIALATAACLGTLVLGIAIGRESVRGEVTVQSELPRASFVLFLHAGPEFEAFTDENFPDRFSDYNEWVGETRRAGHFITGEQFEESGRVVLPAATEPRVQSRLATVDDGEMVSMFMIRATDYEEATRVAMSLPHVRYGGRVVIRRVDPI